MKLIAVGDVHATSDRPWDQAYKLFFRWFLRQPSLNSSDNIFLQVGDFFDASTMTGDLAHDALEFFQNMNCKTRIVLSGNHDYRPRWGNALEILRRVNVHVVRDPEIQDLNGYPVMLLPYIYGNMKATHEQFAYDNRMNARAVFGHFADRDMFGTELDLSFLEKGVDGCTVEHIMLGHDHSQTHNYIGSVYPTAYSERNRSHRIYTLDLETGVKESVALPTFLNYIDVDFQTDPATLKFDYPVILDIYNAPSVHAATEKFPFRIREVFTEEVDVSSSAAKSSTLLDPKVLVKDFVENVEDPGVRSKLTNILEKTGRI